MEIKSRFEGTQNLQVAVTTRRCLLASAACNEQTQQEHQPDPKAFRNTKH